MKSPILWVVSLLLVNGIAYSDDAVSLANPFFAFENGVGESAWSPEQQAKTLAEIGYAGIGYLGTNDLDERLAAFEKYNIKIFNIYVHCYVDKSPPYSEELKHAIKRLKGTGVVIWLTVQGKAEDDTKAVQLVSEIADLSAASDLKVALYPHAGMFVADIEDALRITRQVKRDNQGVSFNLCHELKAGNEARFDELLEKAAPLLYVVSINGADHEGGWDKLIRPLGEGEFDVYPLLAKLKSIGYDGPIGLQCYQVPGDDIGNLKKSLTQWKAFGARMAKD